MPQGGPEIFISCKMDHFESIPYHSGHCGLNLPRTMLRPIKVAQCARPAGMGRKEGYGMYPGVGGALLLPHFC